MKTSIMSEISKVEKEIKPEIENEHFEIRCKIPAVENDLSLFQTNMTHAPPAQFIQAMEKLAQQKEILENFVKDHSQNLREVRVSFNANEKLLELSRVVQECGEVKVSRIENNDLQHSLTTNVNMLTAVPSLTSEVNTGFQVRGIALLENGKVVLSNYDNKRIELRDPQCPIALSSLSLHGQPWGVKMTSDTEGAVAVGGRRLVLFTIQNNKLVKMTEIKVDVNTDFVYHRGLYYVGCNKKIIVYDSNCRKVKDILQKNNVSYLTVRDDNSLCYTSYNNSYRVNEVYCVDMDGSIVFTYKHDQLRDVAGVTVDHVGYIYVCDRGSRNIYQLSFDGKLQRIILKNLPAEPYCISLNTSCEKAVIACWSKVLLYDLK
ncbi:hypothetical protein FSP39_022573 [Pinctada imbricata]|uniref:Uncharacterized protein n=1 Tax=Pinctada imbricata TaxID=66713 RepID=A0AA89CE65_PINIB|nr:hypothetical protein FSP39_022573 [Pinctada imbricata]